MPIGALRARRKRLEGDASAHRRGSLQFDRTENIRIDSRNARGQPAHGERSGGLARQLRDDGIGDAGQEGCGVLQPGVQRRASSFHEELRPLRRDVEDRLDKGGTGGSHGVQAGEARGGKLLDLALAQELEIRGVERNGIVVTANGHERKD